MLNVSLLMLLILRELLHVVTMVELSMGLESSLIIQVNGAGVCQVDPHIVTLCVPSSQFVQRIS